MNQATAPRIWGVGTARTLRAHWMLCELDVDYEWREIIPRTDTMRNEAFLRPGIERPGSWQYGAQYIGWHVVETKSALPGAPNELSLYATESYWHGTGSALRRYTLRLDGFVSIDKKQFPVHYNCPHLKKS